MELLKCTTSVFTTNTYVIISKENNAIIIDPGGDGEKIVNDMKSKDVRITKILLTHGHFDHTAACAIMKDLTGAEVYIHADDSIKLYDVKAALPFRISENRFTPLTPDVMLKNGDAIKQDELLFTTLHTPGHTAGSVVYLLDDIMFSGDTLFKDSIGATQDVSSDYPSLLRSLKKLTFFDKNYRVFPGHGEETTLDYEKSHNPYLQS